MPAETDGSAMLRADTPDDFPGYRPCVGIALFNAQGLVWLGQRTEAGREQSRKGYPWQMPQGGVDRGEAPAEAALRELAEETGVGGELVTPLGEIDGWLTYDFPPDVLARKRSRGSHWIGQKQRWYAFRFHGEDSDVALDRHTQIEFDAWRWAPLRDAPELIIPWKRPVYDIVAREFARFAHPAAG